jgi:hypothetical protein
MHISCGEKSPEGVNGANVLKCDFFDAIMFINYITTWFIGVWGQKDQPSRRDRNPVQILALSFHITGHHAPTRASFHPKSRQEDLHYDTIILSFDKQTW